MFDSMQIYVFNTIQLQPTLCSPGDPNVLIVVTDGYSNVDSDRTIPYARDVMRTGVRVMVVAMGTNINHQEINDMATDPDTENVFTLPDSESMSRTAGQVLDKLCDN